MRKRSRPTVEARIIIEASQARLEAELFLPRRPKALVVLVDGRGETTRSVLDHQVAQKLRDAGFATLLVNLLTSSELRATSRSGLIASQKSAMATRLVDVTGWLQRRPETRRLSIGFISTGVGASATLLAIERTALPIRGLVAVGGRFDLSVDAALRRVKTPMLLITGGDDPVLEHINRSAMRQFRGPSELVVVPGGSRRCTEPHAIEVVAQQSCDFFLTQFAAAAS